MERHGRAGEASAPESHPIKESRDRSNSKSSKNILGNEITAIGLSQVEEVPNSGILRVGRGDTCTVYQVGRRIGLGTFSAVYEGLRLLDHKQVTIKFEVGNSYFSQLRAESQTYKSLKGWSKALFSDRNPPNGSQLPTDRAPDVVFFGDHGRSRLLVMDLLGPSLEDLLDHCGRRFTIETVVMIGITILEELHDRDFIHRDIIAENFVIQGGTERPNVVRAIDFATAKKYRSGNPPKHIKYREGRQFIGTARYASINTHMGCEQSRRDDLEAIWYMLLYFIRRKLPWQCATPTPRAEKHEKILEAKQTTTIEDLCEGRSALCAGLRYIRRLGFEEDPDYDYLRGQLVQALEGRIGDVENGPYDWDKLPSPVRLATQSLNLPPPTQPPKAADRSTSFHGGHSADKRETLKAIIRVTGTWLDQTLFTTKSKQPSGGVITYKAKVQEVLGEIGKFSKDCVRRLQQPRRDAVRIRALLSNDVAGIVGIPATDGVEKAMHSLLDLSDQVSLDFLVQGHSEKTSVLREALKEVKSLAQCELEDLSSPEIREGDRPITPEDHHWL
ncbi:casein kinase i [Verticillium dahliae]